MRVGVGAIVQTSNSFSATRTSLDDFRSHRLVSGRELAGESDLQDPLTRLIARELRETGVEVVPLFEALAPAGGPLDDAAIDGIRELVSDGVAHAGELDRIILHLSGCMLYGDNEPAELMLIEHLKAQLSGAVPTRLVVNFQANVDPRLHEAVELVSSSMGDLDRRFLKALISEQAYPPLYTRQYGPFCLTPLPNHGEPVRTVMHVKVDRLSSFANLEGVVGAHIAYGFPYADTPHTGVSVWVTATSQSRADRVAGMLRELVEHEQRLLVHVDDLLNIEEAVHTAMADAESISILLDTGDDPDGGAPGDGTGLLWGLLDLGARNAILAPLADPVAVEQAFSAGEGASFESEVGARIDRRHGYPVEVRGKVVQLFEHVSGHDSGRVAVIQANGRHDGSVLVVLTEQRPFVADLTFFGALGIDVNAFRIIALKASTWYSTDRKMLRPVPNTMLVATPGITVPDFSYFSFKRLAPGVLPGSVS